MSKIKRSKKEDRLSKEFCGRCYDEDDELFEPKCRPVLGTNIPIGMYHCIDCGAMVCAGIPHPSVCILCRDLKHPRFDIIEEKENESK